MKEIDEVIEAHGGWPAAFQPEQMEVEQASACTEGINPAIAVTD